LAAVPGKTPIILFDGWRSTAYAPAGSRDPRFPWENSPGRQFRAGRKGGRAPTIPRTSYVRLIRRTEPSPTSPGPLLELELEAPGALLLELPELLELKTGVPKGLPSSVTRSWIRRPSLS
jgi:hypothetical protein